MKLSTIHFRFSILLVFFAIAATAQSVSEYASVLANANWGWQSHDGVYYGKATFTDLYGNPQMLSIAKYSSSSMAAANDFTSFMEYIPRRFSGPRNTTLFR